MKLEQKEKALLFSETMIPDIFFAEHLSQIPGDFLKIYMYMIFLSKYGKDIKINDLSKKLNLPIKTITDGVKFLEKQELIVKKILVLLLLICRNLLLINCINLI